MKIIFARAEKFLDENFLEKYFEKCFCSCGKIFFKKLDENISEEIFCKNFSSSHEIILLARAFVALSY